MAGGRTGPLVSVIMPCFNAGRMLRPALASVLGQTYDNLELIFVDNNSTDTSLATAQEVAATAGHRMTITACGEQGVNHARNHGYSLARGDYIQWMDADDAMAPDKISLQVAALEPSGGDIAYGDWTAMRFDPVRAPAATQRTLAQVDDQALRALSGVWYPPHLYLIRRAAADRLQQLGAWRPGRPVGTDVEYSAMAALIGLRFHYVAGASVQYNIWSDGQISGGTPYPARLAALKAIFADLRAFSATPEARARLGRAHRILLNQNWDVWRLPPGSADLTRTGGRLFHFRRLKGGRGLDLRPREAAVARALINDAEPLASSHRAVRLAETMPELAGDHAFIIETLERFQAAGLLERTATTA